MMRILKLLTTYVLLQPMLSVAGSDVNLVFDPFKKPTFAIQRDRDSTSLTPRISTWNPKLRATMVAGKNSMANVDGAIIKVGEKIQGYTLLEVRMRTAIFTRDGNSIELMLDAEESRS